MTCESGKKLKTGIIIGSVAVVVIAVALILFMVIKPSDEQQGEKENLLGAESYEDALEIYYEAINEKDFKKMLMVSPGPISFSEAEIQYYELGFESEYESTSSWSYRIKSICEIPIEKFDDYTQKINEKFEKEIGKTVQIDDGFEVTLEVSYTEGDGEEISSENEFFAYKSGGRWFLTVPYLPKVIGG